MNDLLKDAGEVKETEELEKLEIDKEFESIIPLPSTEERDLLEKSIIEIGGCLNPIIVWDNKIVDGHTRYNICRLLNHSMKEGEKLHYSVKRIEFANRDDAKLWIIRSQFSRRNLNNYQKATLALALKGVFAKQAKENQKFGGGSVHQKSDKPVNTVKELASLACVSHDTMSKVDKIEAEASEKDKEKLTSGEVSINAVYNKLKKKEGDQVAPAIDESTAHRLTKAICDSTTKLSKVGDVISQTDKVRLQLSVETLEKIISSSADAKAA